MILIPRIIIRKLQNSKKNSKNKNVSEYQPWIQRERHMAAVLGDFRMSIVCLVSQGQYVIQMEVLQQINCKKEGGVNLGNMGTVHEKAVHRTRPARGDTLEL